MFNLVFNNNISILPFWSIDIYYVERKEAEDKVFEEYKKLRAIK